MKQTFTFNITSLSKAIREAIKNNRALALAAMRDVSHDLIRWARDRAPVDAGNLVNAITGDVVENPKSIAARVYIPSNAPVTVLRLKKDGTPAKNQSPPANYAIIMHEGHYNLGEKSLAKQGELGVTVGPRYLARAVEENQREIVETIKFKLGIK